MYGDFVSSQAGANMNKPLKTNLSDEVANHIRKKILTGSYAHESHLSEMAIAEELNISRGPIREAMKQLEAEGFVFSPPNGRTRAITFTEADFRDYQKMRFHIECDACAKIIDRSARNGDKQWADNLAALLATMSAAEKNDDNQIVNDCDYRFHDHLVAEAGGSIIQCMWKSLSGIRRSIMEANRSYQTEKKHSTVTLAKRHRNILDCLLKGDKEAVCLALQSHFRSGKNSFNGYGIAYSDSPVATDRSL